MNIAGLLDAMQRTMRADDTTEPAGAPVVYCVTCGDSGYLADRTEQVTRYTACPCGLLAARRSAAERAASGITDERAAWTLRTFVEIGGLRTVASGLSDWATGDIEGLVLTGGVGAGKTGCAIALGNRALRDGLSMRFAEFPRLRLLLHATYRSDDASATAGFLASLTEPALLILDDLGRGELTERDQEFLWLLISDRVEAHKRTIVTLNIQPEDVASWLWTSTWDRIVGSSLVIRLSGKSLRGRP